MIVRPTTIRARLTLWFAAAMAGVLLGFAAVVFLTVRTELTRAVEKRADAELQATAGFVDGHPGDVEELREFNGDALVFILKDGQVEYRSGTWERIGLPGADEVSASREGWLWETPSDHHYWLKVTQVRTPERLFTVAVAVDAEQVQRSLATLAWTIGVSLPLVLLVAAIGGYVLAGRMLAPVRRMATAAERISGDRLSERLPVENAADEFGRLATITNRSLDRLQETLDRQRRFTADASHEMRTPLTAIRSAGEVALRREQRPAEYRDTIGSMLEGVGRLTSLIHRLLVLARADAGTEVVKPEVFDAAEIVRETADLLQPVADEKHVTLSVNDAAGLAVFADRLLVRQALMNVLDNAVKYTPSGGSVKLDTARIDGTVAITIRDSGLGIAPEHREKVFDRFFRVDAARSGGSSGGAGLGLAIARWAVEACGGRVTLDSELGKGSTFTLFVPASLTPPDDGAGDKIHTPSPGDPS